MARILHGCWSGLAGLLVLAACTPAPPFETVNDPFAPLPEAAPVSTQPLATPGVISDEVITPEIPPTVDQLPSAASQANPTDEDAPENSEELGTVTQVNEGGLVERLPNTCQLENYQQYQGTDGLIAVGLVTDRPARLVAPGDIVSQLYDPQRVNFYTNATGQVVRISCG